MKKPSKAEREHMQKVAALGCIICGGEAEIHHILEGRHSQRRSSHMEVIPLCFLHHRTGGHGVAIHAGAKTWREIYGSERDMLERVNLMMEG